MKKMEGGMKKQTKKSKKSKTSIRGKFGQKKQKAMMDCKKIQ